MRMIGRLEEQVAAARFGAYLYGQGIESMIRQDQDGAWAIWVYAEPRVEQAKELFARYREDPENPEYQHAAEEAIRMLEARQQEAAVEAPTYDRRRLWGEGQTGRLGNLTLALIAISVVVGIVSLLGTNKASLHGLFITDFQTGGGYIRWSGSLPEIRDGQLWRLITPIFIHFGFIHLLFNMLWLRDLGGMIENRRGPLCLGILVLVIAAASNLAQFYVSGPSFGGMSGVVYGLLGYIWMKGKHDPASGLYVHPATVKMMIIWFFLCLTGLLGPVANTVHGVGFVVGIAWGWLSSQGLFRNKRA